MQREHGDVEGRTARRKFDHRLLALLLFRNLFRRHLDAGEFGEFFFRGLQQIRTRILDEHDVDLLTGGLLPIEARLRIGRRDDSGSADRSKNAEARARFQ